MERWFNAGVADGFNLMPPSLPDSLDDVVTLIVPELQRRGLYRHQYKGSTLREHFNLNFISNIFYPNHIVEIVSKKAMVLT